MNLSHVPLYTLFHVCVCSLLIHQLLYENSVSPSIRMFLNCFFISLRENIYELLTYIDCCARILLTKKCVKKCLANKMILLREMYKRDSLSSSLSDWNYWLGFVTDLQEQYISKFGVWFVRVHRTTLIIISYNLLYECKKINIYIVTLYTWLHVEMRMMMTARSCKRYLLLSCWCASCVVVTKYI